jgi:hypothetical protein
MGRENENAEHQEEKDQPEQNSRARSDSRQGALRHLPMIGAVEIRSVPRGTVATHDAIGE